MDIDSAPNTGKSDDDAADAASMFALMQTQRRSTHRQLIRRYTVLLLVWAVAWGIGFGCLWLGREIGGVALIPTTLAWIIFGVCIAGAVIWSILAGVLSANDGIRGRSQLQGAFYGWSWTIGMVGVWLVSMALQRAGLSPELAALLYPALFVLMTGVLYLSGGALWRSPVQYALGVVMIIVAIAATWIGAPVHYLIYATVGPLAMVIVAILLVRGVLPHEPRRDAGERRPS